SRQLVIHETRVYLNPETAVHNAAFVQSHSQRLDHSSINLTLNGEAIQGKSDVLNMDHLDRSNMSGFNVDFNFREARSMDAACLKIRTPFASNCDAGCRQRSGSLFPRNSLAAADHIATCKRNRVGLRVSEQ